MHLNRRRSSQIPHDEAARASRGRGLRLAIARSTYHDAITGAMNEAARKTFIEAGGSPDDLEVVEVPGAFELIAAANAYARRDDLDAVVVLGCIITGETTHDQYIAHAVATGIANIIVETGVPIAFGVLTCQSLDQAKERAGGSKGNKGEEAMHAAIESARAVRSISHHSGAAL